ncbi:MAG: 4-hydroxy-3-methylbut-2-enyl diphosphate reductase, partial [Peptococcaceae bacterium]|nr:4-hydroxy-3-methylbut-2-enyl diphosphate reductase [Peptococcaceae bacterium]
MRVLLAADAGMCFGVRRALALAGQAADKAAAAAVRVRLLGELAHNRQMDDWLAAAGIGQGRPEELGPGDIAILPSHGKGPALYAELTAKGCEIVDGTCPLVASAREKALAAKASGHFILILGDERHDEVAAYREWLGDSCLIVPEPTTEFFSPLPENLAVMAQTTESPDRFQQFAARWREGGPAPLVLDTICAATKRRREAAAALAGEVDAFLVIGGRHSANTQNLGEYCRTLRRRTYMVESKDDIDPAWFAGIKSLGITAGASTPEWIIKEVLEMTDEFKDQGQQGFGPEAQSAEMEREQALAGEPTPSPADVTSPKEAVDGEENRESAPAAEAAEIAPVAGLEQAPEQVQAEVQVEAATEAQAEAQAETQAGAAAEAQAETAAEAQAETQAGAAAEAQAEAASEAQAEAPA